MNIKLSTNILDEKFGYQIVAEVDASINPIKALKGLATMLQEQNPDHPLLKAKKYELISLPKKMDGLQKYGNLWLVPNSKRM